MSIEELTETFLQIKVCTLSIISLFAFRVTNSSSLSFMTIMTELPTYITLGFFEQALF